MHYFSGKGCSEFLESMHYCIGILNKFAQRAELQRTQLNKYINNEVVLLNIDVLARMCTVLDCDISDLLEFKKD